MNVSRLTLALSLSITGLAIAVGGCTVAGPPCSNANDCVISVTTGANGQLEVTRSEDPSANALGLNPEPTPSMPAAARRECINAGGEPVSSTYTDANGQYSYECDDVHYVGSDGMNDYYVNIPVTGDALQSSIDTAGTGATQSECAKGWYPDASTGNPSGIPGNWDGSLGLCLPTTTSNQQFAN